MASRNCVIKELELRKSDLRDDPVMSVEKHELFGSKPLFLPVCTQFLQVGFFLECRPLDSRHFFLVLRQLLSHELCLDLVLDEMGFMRVVVLKPD